MSKKYLEDKGYTVEKTEYFNFFSKRRMDLLGIGDLLALNGKEILLVQVTSRDNLSTRRRKARENEKLKLWLKAGGNFILHGWDNYKRRLRIKEMKMKI